MRKPTDRLSLLGCHPMQPKRTLSNFVRMGTQKPNSPLGRAQHALEVARDEVDDTANAADVEPRLEQALGEAVEALEEQQAALNIAAEADQTDAEESGKSDAARRAWSPLPTGR